MVTIYIWYLICERFILEFAMTKQVVEFLTEKAR